MTGIDARLVKRLPAVQGGQPFKLDVHFRIEPGITLLLGASGSGKTSILNCIGGFLRPDEGRILVNDQLFYDGATGVHVPPQRRHCGYIFQDHALFPHMTVRENLTFAASLHTSEAGHLNRHRRINELLESFELSGLADRRPAQLSGGQQQRAALARILITQPRVLLLDEPTRGLDGHLRRSFYQLLRSTSGELGIPVALVSHDLETSFAVSDAIVLLEAGRLLQAGVREDVLAHPASAAVARLLDIYTIAVGQVTFLDPVQNKSRIRIAGQEIEGPYLPGRLLGDSGSVCIRRAEVKVFSKVSPERAPNQLTLRVRSASPGAQGVRLVLEHDFSVTVSEADYELLRSSTSVKLTIPPSAIAFTDK